MTTPSTWYESINKLKERFSECQWWDRVPRYDTEDPEWGGCEGCDYHPRTLEQGSLIQAIIDMLKDNGAPAPYRVYPHCEGEVFFEWHNTDGLSGHNAVLTMSDWTLMFSEKSDEGLTYDFLKLPAVRLAQEVPGE